MPELQPFEARLTVAVRSFADRADTRVDATAVAERSIRHRPSGGAGWLRRTVSVPVWILLVIALLVALFAAALQVGSVLDVRPPVLASCPAGEDPDRPGPTGQERPVGEAGYPVTFDRASGRVVAVAGTLAEVWTFDVCTNSWHRTATRLPPRHVNLPDRVFEIAYDEGADLTVLFGDPVMAYDVESDTLTTLGPRPVSEDVHAVYRSATGQLLVRDDNTARLWTYDVVTDAWEEIAQRGDIPPGPGTGAVLLAYDRSVDRLVLYTKTGGQREGYELDLRSSTWLRNSEVPPDLVLVWGDLGRHEVAFDEAHARTVLFSRGVVIVYDAAAREWQVVFDSHMETDPPPTPGDPTHRQATSLVYDPLNERVISVGGGGRTADRWFVTDDVIAFDVRTRTWIELLAPTRQ
jgi:hypothetical protein